ncbi:MAG: hypothetical protein DA330_09085 [Nitrososphaera sp.]|nr:hypothetical protein [Nitrososphaera sp.]
MGAKMLTLLSGVLMVPAVMDPLEVLMVIPAAPALRFCTLTAPPAVMIMRPVAWTSILRVHEPGSVIIASPETGPVGALPPSLQVKFAAWAGWANAKKNPIPTSTNASSNPDRFIWIFSFIGAGCRNGSP